MPNAMITQRAEDETVDFYSRNVLFPKSRAAGSVKHRVVPRPTSALEAYALRTMSEGDPEFSHYLLRFLHDFSSASRTLVRPMTLFRSPETLVTEIGQPGQVPAHHEEPEPRPLFRVPPFALGLATDSTKSPALDAEAPSEDIGGATGPVTPLPAGAPTKTRTLPFRRVA